VDRLEACGREIGLAFQIIDDLLDVEGHPHKMGKRLGTDLFDGNPSLPVIWGLDLPSVSEAFTTEGCSPDLVDSAIAELRASDVLAQVRGRAIGHASRAAEIIRSLDPSEYRDALSALVSDLVDREL